MAQIQTIAAGDVTVKKIIGALTVDEWLRDVDDFFLSHHVTKNLVLDLSEGSLEHLTYDDIIRITDRVRMYAHSRAGGKTAIVAPTDLEYGISRILGAFAKIRAVPFDTQVFRTLSEAAEWIGVEKLPSLEEDACGAVHWANAIINRNR
ncbi:MAG: hypothetical protein A4E65_02815 [Syntrophorhabdus sp. PtaU1.Bin153]|nr:MAG: hypothetical protein A4E65_02815 [Syntrophorhabdus sp. PtaU1.Bin153]